MSHLSLVYSAPAAIRPVPEPPPDTPQERCFTSRDLIALACWTQRSDDHGYRRVLIEGGDGDGAPEDGGYALIYAPAQDWASWGVARTDAGVTVWHCGSGADLGSHDTMLEALDSLPPIPGRQPSRVRAATKSDAARFSVVRLA